MLNGVKCFNGKKPFYQPLKAPSGWQLNRAKGRAVQATAHPDGVSINQ
jgi:hypothetical protein